MTGSKRPSDEWAFLGRGVLRTLVLDVMATVLGACIGAALGLFAAYVLGLSFLFGAKFGALLGAFAALSARSHIHRLFDYDKTATDKDPKY
ncbi:MAG: hypothetical protein R3D97_05265 [Paracoccaceae bacterium]